MASAVSNLLIYQGSDFIIDFTVENDNGTDFNLTGYTVEDVDEFDGFQIKISLLNHNQPYIPRVKDLRGIALA